MWPGEHVCWSTNLRQPPIHQQNPPGRRLGHHGQCAHETIRAPHIRRLPISAVIYQKIACALNMGRAMATQSLQEYRWARRMSCWRGRLNNAVFSKSFGVGPGIRKQRVARGENRTNCRTTLVTLKDAAVRAWKARLDKGRLLTLRCAQNML